MSASVSRFGHAALRVADLERAVAFATGFLGMRESERVDGTAYLSCNERHHELMLIAGEEVALDHIAFEVDGGDELDELRQRLDGAGWRLLEEPVEAGVEDAVRCVGPGGFVFELFTGMATDPAAGFPDAGLRPLAIEHATLTVSDLDETERFFVEMLGFIQSDRVPGAISWLRCSHRHHDFNLIAGDDSFHHQAWEVDGLTQIGQVADAIAERGEELIWGPGRHGPGHVLFGYFADAEGVINEFCADVEVIPPDYEPRTWPNAPTSGNRWGPQPPADFLSRGVPLYGRAG